MKTTQKAMFVGFVLALGSLSVHAAPKKKVGPGGAAKPSGASAAAGVKVPGQIFIPIDPSSVGSWELGKDEHSSITSSAEAGLGKNKAMALKYDMAGNGLWVSACLEGPFDLAEANSVAFAYRAEGAANSLEIKLEMASEETFGVVLLNATKEKNWTVVNTPISQFGYFWGGSSKQLDLQAMEVKKVCFAVSKKPNDDGKAGKVLVSDISRVLRKASN